MRLSRIMLYAGLGPVFTVPTMAQSVLDGAYIKENTMTQRAVAFPALREADVMWSKRVWRVIDLREKINLPLYYPEEPVNDRRSLFDLLWKAVETGSITAYGVGVVGQDDAFQRALQPSELTTLMTWTDTVWVDMPDGSQVPTPVPGAITSREVKRYKLKEDWYFDRQRGKMDVRIIGIAPMREVKGDDGEVRGYAPLFWLYYPELRYVLKNCEAFNTSNDGERRSFDDLFWQRRFSSYIAKASNVHDRAIADHLQGVDALLEGEAIKDGLFTMEHDLWNF